MDLGWCSEKVNFDILFYIHKLLYFYSQYNQSFPVCFNRQKLFSVSNSDIYLSLAIMWWYIYTQFLIKLSFILWYFFQIINSLRTLLWKKNFLSLLIWNATFSTYNFWTLFPSRHLFVDFCTGIKPFYYYKNKVF